MYTLEELSDLHLADLQARLYSEETIKGRRRVLGAFMRWARRIRYAREVTEKLIRRYLVYLRKRGLGERTIAETLTVLRVFFRYLLRTNQILSDPTWNVRLSGAHSPLPQVLSGLEVERILARPDVETTEGLRDRAILELLYATGMRRTELVNLCVSDIDFSAGSIFIREGKGRKDRIVPAGERALFWLKRYLAIRPNLVKGKDAGNIFLNFYGRAMKKDDVTTLAGALCTCGDRQRRSLSSLPAQLRHPDA